MAKGQKTKTEITNKLLEVFKDNGAFLYNDGKEVRVNFSEDGELVQIKIALTAAKTPVEPGDDNAIPMTAAQNEELSFPIITTKEAKDTVVEPTAEEKANLKQLLSSLGLK